MAMALLYAGGSLSGGLRALYIQPLCKLMQADLGAQPMISHIVLRWRLVNTSQLCERACESKRSWAAYDSVSRRGSGRSNPIPLLLSAGTRGATRALLRRPTSFREIMRGVHQCEMREGLREIADQSLRFGVVLLRKQADVIA